MKACTKCSRTKNRDQFYTAKQANDGLQSWCKACNRVNSWAYKLRTRYGIEPVDYYVMMDQQDGVCGICAAPPQEQKLHVDHCHATGEVRGLLCFDCNTTLGRFRDDPVLLRGLANYLERG